MMLRSALARRLWCLAVAAIAGLVAGCAGRARQLHPVSGNEFSLFPPDRPSPPPITCSGGLDERCACFVRELEQRGQSLDVGGAFALTPPDGSIRTFTRTDALNAAHPITDDTRFPVASITKMFLAAAAVSLAQQGRIDLQQPIARSVPELDGGTGVGSATLHQLPSTLAMWSRPSAWANAAATDSALRLCGRAAHVLGASHGGNPHPRPRLENTLEPSPRSTLLRDPQWVATSRSPISSRRPDRRFARVGRAKAARRVWAAPAGDDRQG